MNKIQSIFHSNTGGNFMKAYWWMLIFVFLIFIYFFASSSSDAQSGSTDKDFSQYWFQGKAELTSYSLEQARYGEIHQGHAVLIFVTEDFSRSKQVKLDNPTAARDDAVKVIKLNFTKKFNTGIYPYSMMTSVFTPLGWDAPAQTFKITTSSQEWCGHTFVQMNLSKSGYRLQQNSYFESEGDLTLTLPIAMPEDEIWNIIRLQPDHLPTGNVRFIPGTMFQRLRHIPWKLQEAKTKLVSIKGKDHLKGYTITYPELERSLTIYFNNSFPYQIEGWEETYMSGWGVAATRLTTRAKKIERILLDYWHKNRVKDEELRHKLGL